MFIHACRNLPTKQLYHIKKFTQEVAEVAMDGPYARISEKKVKSNIKDLTLKGSQKRADEGGDDR